ncbi:hypothetical protein WMY93_019418 [Mugilogobius chulae]|uniref:Uncharacterized protein n=1 Tax=Mugilogobius chulae TaxID=88201 RepID=A0AAW0NJ41_9GOBI
MTENEILLRQLVDDLESELQTVKLFHHEAQEQWSREKDLLQHEMEEKENIFRAKMVEAQQAENRMEEERALWRREQEKLLQVTHQQTTSNQPLSRKSDYAKKLEKEFKLYKRDIEDELAIRQTEWIEIKDKLESERDSWYMEAKNLKSKVSDQQDCLKMMEDEHRSQRAKWKEQKANLVAEIQTLREEVNQTEDSNQPLSCESDYAKKIENDFEQYKQEVEKAFATRDAEWKEMMDIVVSEKDAWCEEANNLNNEAKRLTSKISEKQDYLEEMEAMYRSQLEKWKMKKASFEAEIQTLRENLNTAEQESKVIQIGTSQPRMISLETQTEDSSSNQPLSLESNYVKKLETQFEQYKLDVEKKFATREAEWMEMTNNLASEKDAWCDEANNLNDEAKRLTAKISEKQDRLEEINAEYKSQLEKWKRKQARFEAEIQTLREKVNAAEKESKAVQVDAFNPKMISVETQTETSNQPLPCESDYVRKMQKGFEEYKLEIEKDLARREAEWTEMTNKLKSEKDAWCKEAKILTDGAKNLTTQISEKQDCLEKVEAKHKRQLDKWKKTKACFEAEIQTLREKVKTAEKNSKVSPVKAFHPKMISMETQTEEEQEIHSFKDLHKTEQAWKAEKAELLRQIEVMKSWDVQPTSLNQVESTWVRARNYIEQEVQFGLFRQENSWAIEKRNMENQIQTLSQLNKALETKVKDHWQQLQEKTTLYDGNEKAFIHKETDLLRKIAELSNQLTEKREQEITWMKDLAALKSQLAKKENQILLSETEMDAKTMTWLNEKAKFENERKKFEDESKKLVERISQLQKDKSQTEMELTSERDYLKMKLASIQQNPKLMAQTRTNTTFIQENDLHKATLLNRLTEQLREIEELKLQQTQLIENNRKWKENFNSYCERKALEFKEKEEIWHKQKLQLENEFSKKNYELQKQQMIIAQLEGNLATVSQSYPEQTSPKFKKEQEIWAKEKSAFEKDVDKYSHKIESQQKEIERQRFEIEKLMNKVEKRKEKSHSLREEFAIERSKRDAKFKELESDLLKKNHEVEKLTHDTQELQNKIQTLHETLAKYSQNYHDNMDLKLKQQEILTKEKCELEMDCSKKKDQTEKLQETLYQLQQQIVKRTEIRNDPALKQQHEIWTEEKLQLTEECSKKNADMVKLRAKIEELDNALATEQLKCDDIDFKLKQQQEMWTKEKLQLTEDCFKKNAEMEKLRAKIEELENALATEQQKNRDDLDSELRQQQENWIKEKLKLTEDCTKMTDEIASCEPKLRSLGMRLRQNSRRIGTTSFRS